MPLVRKDTRGKEAGAKDGDAIAQPAPGVPDQEAAIAALGAGSPQDRWTAARQLAASPGAAQALGRAVGAERDERVREAIFTSLARIDSAGSLEAVLPHLRSDDAGLRTGALDAMRTMTGAVGTRLDALLRDIDPDVRVLACELARDLPSVRATELLARVLDNDPAVNVCAAAVDVLAEIGSTDALPSLARCADRFPDQAFLGFAVKVACERIRSQPAERHE
jgi:HEAT repeat protein